jgi:two-component system chemotaxis sensor kinase CheA
MDIQRDLILKSFLGESEEGLSEMEDGILQLESQPDDADLIQIVFRVVHTIKGNASLLELQSLLAFAHTLEDLLDALRQNKLKITSDITALLLASLDILREMVAGAAIGKEGTSRKATEVLKRIEAVCKHRSKPDTGTSPSDAAPIAAESALPSPGTTAMQSTRTLRVDVEKLDRLLNLAGEIAIARAHLSELLDPRNQSSPVKVLEAHRSADELYVELQETVRKVRMVPVGPLFRQYVRTVRDLSKSHGKLAQLRLEGEDVEVDTSVVEHLRPPLLHMVRNAVDHGIEPPAVRKRIGKPPIGSITIRAAHKGSNILIEVTDDGAGLDRKSIIETSRKKGLSAELEKLSDHEVFQLIFEPGFSTAGQVSDLSGRGVGMDVVRRNVQALRGNVHITSQPGIGSTISIRLPLTLAIIEGFCVGVADETYVIPVDQIVECLDLPEQFHEPGRKEGVLGLRDHPLPFFYLGAHFGLGCGGARQSVVVVQQDTERVGIAVDALYGTTQTVIKPLPVVFRDIPGVSGSAILGNGKVAMILDIPALLRAYREQEQEAVRRE